jgi:hypothetical protein
VLKHGDAVLFEAYESLLRKHKHSDHFSLLREVADSIPPTTMGLMDKYVQPLSRNLKPACVDSDAHTTMTLWTAYL